LDFERDNEDRDDEKINESIAEAGVIVLRMKKLAAALSTKMDEQIVTITEIGEKADRVKGNFKESNRNLRRL
jgi:hypothetical protein